MDINGPFPMAMLVISHNQRVVWEFPIFFFASPCTTRPPTCSDLALRGWQSSLQQRGRPGSAHLLRPVIGRLGRYHGDIPSGKRLHNYGKSPCYSWENPLYMVIFHSCVKLPEGSRKMGYTWDTLGCNRILYNRI